MILILLLYIHAIIKLLVNLQYTLKIYDMLG